MTKILRKLAVWGLAFGLAHPLCSFAANPAPNIVLAVAQIGSPIAAGQAVTYTVTASNTGNASAGTVVLSASVPNYTTIAQAQANGWYCTRAWPCVPGDDVYMDVPLGIGQTATHQFSAQLVSTGAPANGTVISTTVSTSVIPSPTVVQQTVVRSKTGLNVAISCPPGAVAPLSFVNCDLSYSNSGSSAITANLSYSFPAALTVLSVTGGGSVGSGVVTWSGIALAVRGVGHQTVGLQVPAGAAAGTEFPHSAVLSDSSGVALSASAGTASFVAATGLQIGVAATPSPVEVGGVATYSITVSNTGATATGGYYLYATVPNFTTVSQAEAIDWYCSGSWPCQPGDQLYIDVSLEAGRNQTVQFAATVNAGATAPPVGTLLTTSVADALGGAATGSTVVANLGPTLIISAPEQVAAGGTYTYTLTYANDGLTKHNTLLTMALPLGTTLVSASKGAKIVEGGITEVTWTKNTFTAGEVVSHQLTVTAPTNVAAGTLVTGSAAVLDAASLLSYSQASADTLVGGTNPLQIGVTATPSPVQAGGVATYSITVSNTGATATGGYYLYATVPNFTTVAQSEAINWYCSGSWPCQPGDQLYIDISLAAGRNQTVQFAASVNAGATAPPLGTLLTTSITDAFGGAATGSTMVANLGPNLVLSAPEQVSSGGAYTYTLIYGNNGSATPNALLTMTVPLGTTLVSASGGATIAKGKVTTVTWTQDAFAPGEVVSQQLTVRAQKTDEVGSLVTGSAAVLDATSLLSYSQSSADTLVGGTNPLQLGVTETPSAVQAGGVVTYAITVSNAAATATGGYYLYATVPNFTTVSQAEAINWYCSGSWPCQPGDQLYIDVSLSAGRNQIVQFSATVDAGDSAPPLGTLLTTNVADAFGGATVGSTVVANLGPTLVMTAPEQVSAGGTYTYTLTYGNSGSATPNTVLTMAVPLGTTLVSTSGGGTVTNGMVTWSQGALAPGQVVSQQMAVTAPTSGAAGSLVSGSAAVLDAASLLTYSQASADTLVGGTDPLQIGVNVTPSPVQPGGVATYSITLTNTSATATGGYYLYATVPNFTTVAQTQAVGWYCSGSWPCQPGDQLYIDVSLSSGQSQTVQFAATVDAGAAAPPSGSLLTTSIADALGGAVVSILPVN